MCFRVSLLLVPEILTRCRPASLLCFSECFELLTSVGDFASSNHPNRRAQMIKSSFTDMSRIPLGFVLSTLAIMIAFSRETINSFLSGDRDRWTACYSHVCARSKLSSSMFSRGAAAVAVLCLPLLFAGVITGRASDDDSIVIRCLASGSGTTGDCLISCWGEFAIAISPPSLFLLSPLSSYFCQCIVAQPL